MSGTWLLFWLWCDDTELVPKKSIWPILIFWFELLLLLILLLRFIKFCSGGDMSIMSKILLLFCCEIFVIYVGFYDGKSISKISVTGFLYYAFFGDYYFLGG